MSSKLKVVLAGAASSFINRGRFSNAASIDGLYPIVQRVCERRLGHLAQVLAGRRLPNEHLADGVSVETTFPSGSGRFKKPG
jgi:hypothetical protein